MSILLQDHGKDPVRLKNQLCHRGLTLILRNFLSGFIPLIYGLKRNIWHQARR